jgi:hypothetical protein
MAGSGALGCICEVIATLGRSGHKWLRFCTAALTAFKDANKRYAAVPVTHSAPALLQAPGMRTKQYAEELVVDNPDVACQMPKAVGTWQGLGTMVWCVGWRDGCLEALPTSCQ